MCVRFEQRFVVSLSEECLLLSSFVYFTLQLCFWTHLFHNIPKNRRHDASGWNSVFKVCLACSRTCSDKPSPFSVYLMEWRSPDREDTDHLKDKWCTYWTLVAAKDYAAGFMNSWGNRNGNSTFSNVVMLTSSSHVTCTCCQETPLMIHPRSVHFTAFCDHQREEFFQKPLIKYITLTRFIGNLLMKPWLGRGSY